MTEKAEKVLVVDDDVSCGQVMMLAMEAMGHEVCLVRDGRDALHAIRQFVPDVVLSDIKMPGMLGFELCEKLKADARLKHTLFIAQTCLDSHQSRQRSFEAGFDYHMVKPVDINALLEIVYLDRAKKALAQKAG